MLYGLQGMSSDCSEVRALLRELPRLVKTCTEQFTAQEISNMLYGLQRLHLDAPEVSALIDALLPHINSSMEALHPQHVSNALYGISGLFDESVPSTVIIYRYFKSHFNRVVAVDRNQCICLYSINHNNQWSSPY